MVKGSSIGVQTYFKIVCCKSRVTKTTFPSTAWSVCFLLWCLHPKINPNWDGMCREMNKIGLKFTLAEQHRVHLSQSGVEEKIEWPFFAEGTSGSDKSCNIVTSTLLQLISSWIFTLRRRQRPPRLYDMTRWRKKKGQAVWVVVSSPSPGTLQLRWSNARLSRALF